MLVQDMGGNIALTRSGAFVPNADGHLINSAGFTLLGYPLEAGGQIPPVVNGTTGLTPVIVANGGMRAVATTAGSMVANLPAGAEEILAAQLPLTNDPGAVSSARSSVVVYGNLGEEITLDVHFAKTSTPGEWQMVIYNAADRDAGGGFPYANGPLADTTLTFDAYGQPTGPTSLTIPVPGGGNLEMDISKMTQVAGDYSVDVLNANGSAPSRVQSIEIAADGTLYEVYENGARYASFSIPLATVISPDRLSPQAGNVYLPSSGSGDIRIGVPGSSGFGTVQSGALESSTVDLATELADMIEAQRNYTANSRVFQTGSELMELVVNLKR